MRPAPRKDYVHLPFAPTPALQVALRALLDAHESAQELRQPAWDFALDIHDLHATGLASSAIRALLCQGYLEQGVERTRSAAKHRTFRPTANLSLTDRSCFVLTPAGLALARAACRLPPANDQPAGPGAPVAGWNGEPARPRWDDARRELRWQGELVKQFRQPAPDQEAILAAFEEEDWPPHIDDPLSPQPGRDAKDRLHQTIHNLNRHQQHCRIRFEGDGKGRGVCWSLRTQS